jgi:putative tricarboxylic transport membrane protein
MRRNDIIFIPFWIGLSVAIMFFSYRLDLGKLHNPGPGLFPFLLGAALLLVTCYFLLQWSLKRATPDEAEMKKAGRQNYRKVGFVLLSLLGFALALEKLGYLVTTVLLLALLFGMMEPRRWRFVIIASIVTALITYFGFLSLGVRFPEGMLRLR